MSTLPGVFHRRFIQTAATALLIASGMLAPTTATDIAGAEPKTITVLQLNLCNSGHASCFEDGSVTEAILRVNELETKPDVITLNEVCQNDVFAIANATGYQEKSALFFPAFSRRDDGSTSTTPRKCKDRDGYQNEDYGIGLMVRNHGHVTWGIGLVYGKQNESSREARVAVCAGYRGLNACTTHLAVEATDDALAQCMELRELTAELARQQPTVVAGDFNLKYDEDVQKCVPEGFFRKGDGKVQHVMASGHFEFVSSRKIPLDDTDHDGLMVTIRLK